MQDPASFASAIAHFKILPHELVNFVALGLAAVRDSWPLWPFSPWDRGSG